MACDTSQLVKNSVTVLLPVTDDFMNFSETSDYLQKTLDGIQEVIQCRTKIFMQKTEKHKQILDSQMMKLDNERKEYIKKSEAVMNKLGEAKSQLMQIEHSYFAMRNKLNLEKQSQKSLEEKIKLLQLDSKQKNAKFYQTSELFTTLISWYQEYLNLAISFEKGNSKIITVTFKESKKDFKGYPFVKLEKLEGNKFQILHLHPLSEKDDEIISQMIEPHAVIPFLHKFRKNFLTSI